MGRYLVIEVIKVTPLGKKIDYRNTLLFQSHIHVILKASFISISLISYSRLMIENKEFSMVMDTMKERLRIT